MIWYAVILHLVWGIVGITNLSTPLFTTTFYGLLQLTGSSQLETSLILIGASVSSTLSLLKFRDRRDLGLLLVLPQQFLLLVSMGGAIQAVILSKFADGTIRPSAFILIDQFPAILVACLHSLAIFEMYSRRVSLWLGRI
jgi:hypothetical protein